MPPTFSFQFLPVQFSIRPVYLNEKELGRHLHILQDIKAEIAPLFHLKMVQVKGEGLPTSILSLDPLEALTDCMAFSRVAFLNSCSSKKLRHVKLISH